MSDFNYSQIISALTAEQRLHFYELFAHNLTIANRGICSEDRVSEAERLERLKLVNEVQHRITAKIYTLRLKLHEWTEEDTWQMIEEYVAGNKGIEGHVHTAIRDSYGCIAQAAEDRIE